MVERCLSLRVMRFLMLVLVVMLTLGPITRAYADDFAGGDGGSHNVGGSYPNFGTVWYGPNSYTGSDELSHNRYGVVAFTKYDAAVYNCMGSDFSWDDLSNTKKKKLINDSAFKSFADLFVVGKPALTNDWSGDAAITMAWNSAKELYGETYCYNADYTYEQRQAAINAIKRIMAEEDSSSGGSTEGVEDGDYIYWPATQFYDNPKVKNVEYLGMRKSVYQSMLNIIGDSKKSILIFEAPDRGVSSQYFRFFILDSPDDVEFRESNLDGNQQYYLIFKNAVTTTQGGTPAIGTATVDGKVARRWTFSAGVSENHYDHASGDIFQYWPINYYAWAYGGVSGDGGSGDDEEPPEPWPTPPTTVTPVPPEVPTPGDPTTPIPPDPVEPTPGNPWLPIPDEDITITGDDFQDLLDALNEHCIHLQNSIQSNVSQLWDLQSDFLGTQFQDLFGQISDNFTWLGNDVITEHYNDLKSYLYELFEWLGEQLNFDVQVEGGQYDDTSVLYWLKQIWAKLPTGINSRPTDPVTNPTGWWDWLTQLLNNLAADLMALGHDKLAGILETLNELRNKFPFSLPWDVAALLGLLVGVPECPEFDMPCYTVSLGGLQEVGTYHITLEPYETVWEGVKWIETLAFAVYLITHTGGLMDMVTKTVRPR